MWLVQHPRERFHPTGTARIARLGLNNFSQTTTHTARDDAPKALPADAVLLFPGKDVPTLAREGAGWVHRNLFVSMPNYRWC